ncbi:MAG TPA: YccF domain-containing protein [Acidimicrobiia bacterium]
MFRVLLNLIWLVLAGMELAIGYAIGGLVMMLTIVGIPFGIQAFKLAGFTLWPFGRAVVPDEGSGFFSGVGNVLWLILVGWWLAAAHLVFGVLLCLTLIGIPMGIASFRMAGLALWPMGRRIVDLSSVGSLPEEAHTVGRRPPSTE